MLRTVHGRGLLEGGSLAFANERTAVVGMNRRQNQEGVRQVEAVLAEMGVQVVRVPLAG